MEIIHSPEARLIDAAARRNREGSRAIIVLAGDPPDADLLRDVTKDAYVIAVDGGARAVIDAGITPDIGVGDWDSAPEMLPRLRALGVPCIELPCDKDETDGEAALRVAMEHGCTNIGLLGATGGRLDQMLGNMGLLLKAARAGLRAQMWSPTEWAVTSHEGRATWVGWPGRTVSLVPLGGDAVVTTEHLRWPLADHHLRADSTLGISNEMTGHWAAVNVAQGVVLAIANHPSAAQSAQWAREADEQNEHGIQLWMQAPLLPDEADGEEDGEAGERPEG